MMTRTFPVHTDDGIIRNVYVLDALFNEDEVSTYYKSLVQRRDLWLRVNKNPLRTPSLFSASFGLEKQGELLAAMERITVAWWQDVIILDHGHMTISQFGDTPSIHQDSICGHKFVPAACTTIYYANPHWDPEWHAETIFYDRDGEIAAAVIPKPGRIVIFDSLIHHSATSPARFCFEPRIVALAIFGHGPR